MINIITSVYRAIDRDARTVRCSCELEDGTILVKKEDLPEPVSYSDFKAAEERLADAIIRERDKRASYYE